MPGRTVLLTDPEPRVDLSVRSEDDIQVKERFFGIGVMPHYDRESSSIINFE